MDDPLSAVDVHVGHHIFKHVIGPEGILADKVYSSYFTSVSIFAELWYICILKYTKKIRSWNVLIFLLQNLIFQTRLLVTHGMHYLKEMNHIVLLEDGEIVVQGEFGKLLEESEKFERYVKIDSRQEEDEGMNKEAQNKTVK